LPKHQLEPEEAADSTLDAAMGESGLLPKKKNRTLTRIGILLVAVFAVLLILVKCGLLDRLLVPSITLVEPKQAVSASSRDEIVIDVVVSDLPAGSYPAASISVAFDKNRLEFVGIKQGTMMAMDGKPAAGGQAGYYIPVWNCDVAASNRRGVVNVMYLDITGGDYAYTEGGFTKGRGDILLRLTFRLRDSAQAGDSYELTFQDACLATIGGSVGKTSLAMDLKTIRARNCQIKVR